MDLIEPIENLEWASEQRELKSKVDLTDTWVDCLQ